MAFCKFPDVFLVGRYLRGGRTVQRTGGPFCGKGFGLGIGEGAGPPNHRDVRTDEKLRRVGNSQYVTAKFPPHGYRRERCSSLLTHGFIFAKIGESRERLGIAPRRFFYSRQMESPHRTAPSHPHRPTLVTKARITLSFSLSRVPLRGRADGGTVSAKFRSRRTCS